jgi:type IVB pilus formation R64 PilN family outer membrane protein
MKRLFITLLLCGLCGCAITPTVRQINKEHEDLSDKSHDLIEQARQMVRDKAEPNQAPPTQFWLGAHLLKDDNQNVSPTMRRPIVMRESYSNLAEVIDALSRDIGLPTRLTRDPIPNSNTPITLNYEGEVSGVLDLIANRYNLYWTENQGMVVFSITQTKSFRIKAVPASATSQITVSGDNSSAGGSGGGTGSQSAAFQSSSLDTFKAIEETVRQMVSPVGRVSSSPAAGVIIVSDVPEKVEVIGRYIDEQNNQMSTQVFFDFRVILLSAKRESQFGGDWNALFTAISQKYNLGLIAPSGLSGSPGQIGLTIPSTATGGAGQWQGSNVFLKALEQYAIVTQVTSAPLLTLNNKPTQFRRGRTLSYITASATQTANVGTTTAAQLARERLGFSLNVLPHAQPDGTIVLQTAISVKLLNQLRVVTQGSGQSATTSEAPDTDDLDFGTQSFTKSGDTIVLAGFEQVTGNSTQQGVGFVSNALMGGETGTRQKDAVVFILTPTILPRVQ